MCEFRLLRPEEIECRPQSVKNGKCNLLLYMTSRTVTDLLDETVGSRNWTSEFYTVNNMVVCRIGIWDEDKKMFVYKSDTGSESNIEAEKGLFSDCYKRCLSRWGVNELYSAPSIVVDDDGYGNRGYYVSLIRYDETARKITELHIANKFDKEVFSWKYGEKPKTTTQNTEPTKSNYDLLVEFCKKAKADGESQEELKKFYNFYKDKANTWKNTFNPSALWNKWKERAKKPHITPTKEDYSIQDYEERTYGADDASFYY